MKRTRQHAFTLVELLVVIGIIAILISILLPALNKARNSGKMITCQSNMRQLGLAFQQYLATWRCYPNLSWPEALNPYVNGTLLTDAGGPNTVLETHTNANVDKVAPLGLIHCPSVPFVGRNDTKVTLTYAMNGIVNDANYWEILAMKGNGNYGNNLVKRVKANAIRQPTEFAVLTEMWHTSNPEQCAWTNTWYRLYNVNGMSALFVHDRKSNVLFADGHVGTLTAPGNISGAYSKDIYTGYIKLSDQNDPMFNYDGAKKRSPNVGMEKQSKYTH